MLNCKDSKGIILVLLYSTCSMFMCNGAYRVTPSLLQIRMPAHGSVLCSVPAPIEFLCVL